MFYLREGRSGAILTYGETSPYQRGYEEVEVPWCVLSLVSPTDHHQSLTAASLIVKLCSLGEVA